MSPIYLDYCATTPMRQEVRDAMAPYQSEAFGNPSSTHSWGRRAAAALADARTRAAQALGAQPSEILFVRGGTESDNLAVLGRARFARAAGERPVVAVSAIEHSAVLEAAEAVESDGGSRHVIPVDSRGTLDEGALERALAAGPHVLSVMWVNNEVGTVMPVPAIADAALRAGVVFHTDAVQAVGKLPVRVDQTPVGLLTLTGHKIYGPKGTGLLFLRRGVQILPGIFGGGQERGLRPGTEDVAGAVGLAEALTLAVSEMERERDRLGRLRDQLEGLLLARFPDLVVHGGEGQRAPHVANLGVPGVDGVGLVPALDMAGLAASSGSACHSGAARASHVLAAMYGADASTASVRFSVGRLTSESDVGEAAALAGDVIDRLRLLGPGATE